MWGLIALGTSTGMFILILMSANAVVRCYYGETNDDDEEYGAFVRYQTISTDDAEIDFASTSENNSKDSISVK